MRDFLRKLVPDSLLEWNRERKKEQTRASLNAKKDNGDVVTQAELVTQLRGMGIKKGDVLMVHSAMSKMGYLENGPQTFVDALFKAVGDNGTVCMPSSPVKTLQLEHIQNHPVFDVSNTASAMGAISEYFRKLDGTVRSQHPTEPVCAKGKLAQELVKDHFGERSPYTVNSPWKKMMEAGGKILYVGVTLDNAGTHLHTLEDAVDFKYPVYAKEEFEVTCIDEKGEERTMKTKVHNPEFSKKRKCDELIPWFEKVGVLSKHKLGEAPTLLLGAKGMFEAMVQGYEAKKITMYTPNGEKIAGYD